MDYPVVIWGGGAWFMAVMSDEWCNKNRFQNKIKSNQQANNGSISKCTISNW